MSAAATPYRRLARHYLQELDTWRTSPDGVERFERDWPQIAKAQAWAARADEPGDVALVLQFWALASDLLAATQALSLQLEWASAARSAVQGDPSLDPMVTTELALAEAGLLYQIGDYALARRTVEHVLEALGEAAAVEEPAYLGMMRGQALGNLATLTAREADAAAAIPILSEAIELLGAYGDHDFRVQSLGNMGMLLDESGRPDEAVGWYERAIAAARDLGDIEHLIRWLVNMGNSLTALARHAEAEERYEEALRAIDESGQRTQEASALGNLGSLQRELGELDRAIELHQRALRLNERYGDRYGAASQMHKLALATLDRGGLTVAIPLFVNAAGRFRAIGLDEVADRIDSDTAELVARQHYIEMEANGDRHLEADPEAARTQYRAGLRAARTAEDAAWASQFLAKLAWVDLQSGDTPAAIEGLGEAIALARATGSASLEAHHTEVLAEAQILAGEPAAAEELYMTALELRDGEASHRSFYARMNLASIALEASDADRARRHLEDALAEAITLDDHELMRIARERLHG